MVSPREGGLEVHLTALTLGLMLLVSAAAAGPAQSRDNDGEGPAALTPQVEEERYAQGDPTMHKAALLLSALDRRKLRLRSSTVLIIDQELGSTVYAKNSDQIKSIASITKLMTAMVVLDAGLAPDERITITSADKDRLRNSRSHLSAGTVLTRMELLQVALMSSENRAAAALARTYPGGTAAFITAMNRKAQELGMQHTRFVDSTGLHTDNTSTARDLVVLLRAAYQYPDIREITTTPSYVVTTPGKARNRMFRNTNLLVRKPRKSWDIGLSKTGYILEAGRCLVMQAEIAARPMFIVLLDAWGKYTSIGDANRIRKWLESNLRSANDLG